ncbi:hypothetical protein [Streptomyces clavifer]|uniref:hypothetical protein n=1 Tax=Streptomyces clavifer TaxID=68188 RepID=UPI0033C8088B
MWDYAKLSAEAAKLGGPAALRTAYKRAGRTKGLEKGLAIGLWAGRTQGVVVTAGVAYAGNALYKTLRARSVANAEPTPQSSEETPEPGEGIDPTGAAPS